MGDLLSAFEAHQATKPTIVCKVCRYGPETVADVNTLLDRGVGNRTIAEAMIRIGQHVSDHSIGRHARLCRG